MAKSRYISKYITCKKSNVIYLITCRSCKLQYVGETGRKVRNRMYGHCYLIRKNSDSRSTPVSVHFNKAGHKISDISFQVIERCPIKEDLTATDTYRKRREKFWMWQLRTIAPAGINHMV